MLLEGLFLPMTTPFYGDGRVYLRKLEHNAERYSRTPAAGLALLTRNGEADRLSDEERREVLVTAAAAAAKTKVLLADVSHAGVREALRLADVAAGAMYDVVLLRVPRAALAEQRMLVQAVADRSPLPVVVVEDEAELPLETMSELARHPGVIGCVTRRGSNGVEQVLAVAATVRREVTVTPIFEAVTRRMLRMEVPALAAAGNYVSAESLTGGTTVLPMMPAIKTRTREVGFQLLAGATEGALPALRSGARGTMQPFAVCAPQACYEVLAAWKDGDEALADEKFSRVMQAAKWIEEEIGVAAVKAACDLTGYFGGAPRLPGAPVSGEQRVEIERQMRGMRS